jgi:hypothetical protein
MQYFLAGKPDRKLPLGRPCHRLNDNNISMNLEEKGWHGGID